MLCRGAWDSTVEAVEAELRRENMVGSWYCCWITGGGADGASYEGGCIAIARGKINSSNSLDPEKYLCFFSYLLRILLLLRIRQLLLPPRRVGLIIGLLLLLLAL